MTVKELREILENLEDDCLILIDNWEGGYASIDCEMRQNLYTGEDFLYIGDIDTFI